MPGGLMQLIAYGAEDLYLTGNPQITHFKMVYRRHTNFSTEYIEQYFFTLPNFTTDQKTIAKVKIQRNADLLHDTYLVYDLPNVVSTVEENFHWVRNLGHNIIFSVEITVDGQRISIQYGQWLNIWSELTVTQSKRFAYDRLVGHFYKLRPGHGEYYPEKGDNNIDIPTTRLIIPFEFWFCQNPGLSIPLIALQYTELWIYVEFNPLNDLFTIGQNNLAPCAFFGNCENTDDPLRKKLEAQGLNACNVFWHFVCRSEWGQNTFLLANYIYLDTDERRKFAQSSHEYLFHQVQRRLFTGLRAGTNIMELDLFHPTKELIWVIQRENVRLLNDWNNYTFVELYHDYINLKQEYKLKFDFLNHPEDTNFLTSTNDFIADIEKQPFIRNEPCFLGPGLSKNLAFNDYVNIMLSAKLVFNGHDRFEERSHVFFNYQQPYKYHTHSAPDGVNVYSFALHPEETQPSGTCNFSRLQRAELMVRLRRDKCDNDEEINIPNSYNLFLYGLSYNVFRIMGGIGQVAFQ